MKTKFATLAGTIVAVSVFQLVPCSRTPLEEACSAGDGSSRRPASEATTEGGNLRSEEFAEKVLGSHGLVILKFTASWCGPCQRAKPEVEAVARSRGDVTIYSVDLDEQGTASFDGETLELSKYLNVQYIPDFAAYSEGKLLLAESPGKRAYTPWKGRAVFEKWIDELLAKNGR